MSLVAYAVSSSDEESESESEESAAKVEIVAQKPSESNPNGIEGNISDDEDVYSATDINLEDLHVHKSFALNLPKPVNTPLVDETADETTKDADKITLTLAALPMPKHAKVLSQNIIEEDDEFLHKKVEPEKIVLEKPPSAPVRKGRVQITIPSLKDFSDVDQELALKAKNSNAAVKTKVKGSSLLNILPKAKSEQNFAKNPNKVVVESQPIVDQQASSEKKPVALSKHSLIPDTVKNRRPAHNTEGVDGIKLATKKPNVPKQNVLKGSSTTKTAASSDSEDSDNDSADFFSFKGDRKLPEVSTNEINALIASKAAKIASAPNEYLNAVEANEQHSSNDAANEEAMREAQKRYSDQRLDAEAMQALVGGTAKRRRKEAKEIEIMDISAAQVLPSRDEWMRTALASSTEYQPTGVLNDDEPAAGTRRKHQITYLAHKAKANEAELQAMWSVNRQNRRATQSKYGF